MVTARAPAAARSSPTPTTASSSTTTRTPTPTRVRADNPAASTSCRAPTTRPPTTGTTRPGRGDSWPDRWSTSSTSAPSRRATSTVRSSRLDHLRSIGVDLVELMPVNAFNGTHNWGYDGVDWFAVTEQYGGPAGVPALRRRLPRGGPGRRAGRRLQPPRPVGELPAAVRALPQAGSQHLGRPGQPRRRGLGRGPAVRPRQRPDVVRGLPRRRAAARRRARPGRHLARAHPRGDGDRDAGAVGPSATGRSR